MFATLRKKKYKPIGMQTDSKAILGQFRSPASGKAMSSARQEASGRPSTANTLAKAASKAKTSAIWRLASGLRPSS